MPRSGCPPSRIRHIRLLLPSVRRRVVCLDRRRRKVEIGCAADDVDIRAHCDHHRSDSWGRHICLVFPDVIFGVVFLDASQGSDPIEGSSKDINLTLESDRSVPHPTAAVSPFSLPICPVLCRMLPLLRSWGYHPAQRWRKLCHPPRQRLNPIDPLGQVPTLSRLQSLPPKSRTGPHNNNPVSI